MAAQQQLITSEYQNNIFEQQRPVNISLIGFNWLKDLLKWWYIASPVWYILSLRRVLTIVDDQFSISLLLANFFTPWHRDYTFVGFFIGIAMKLLFLPIGISVLLFVLFSYLLFIIVWLFLPPLTILGIISSPFFNIV